MNDRRFIELLNLYLDQQLDSAEAAELEAEVSGNASRRRIHDQYCRLQRGCSLLGERERDGAPASQAFARSLREAERKMAAPRRALWSPAFGGLFAASAMAAGLAVILVVNREPSTGPGSVDFEPTVIAAIIPALVPEPVVAEAVAADLTGVEPETMPVFDFQPALVAAGSGVVRSAREAEIAANDREALEWMQRVEKLPIQRAVFDEQVFESRATLQPDSRVFRGHHSIPGSAEFTAFQFQR